MIDTFLLSVRTRIRCCGSLQNGSQLVPHHLDRPSEVGQLTRDDRDILFLWHLVLYGDSTLAAPV